jgi:signal peptidase I
MIGPRLMTVGAPPPPLWRRWVFGRNPKWTLARIIVLVVTAVVVRLFILLPIRIEGISMYPTYRDGSVNFVNLLAYRRRPPQRGDVVSVQMSGRHVMLCKRVVATPGETIAIQDGVVLINGRPLPEPYVKERTNWVVTPRQMGKEEYFVIGDNRGMPQQAHEFGATQRSRILGKLLW